MTDDLRHDRGPLVGGLAARHDRADAMGGDTFVERQHSLGKLTVRERLELLLDPGSWLEYGSLADHMDAALGDRYLAADGVVCGIGEIDGRRVAVIAYDFTVMAGAMGEVGEQKTHRMREPALRQRIPVVWLLDSAGARIQQAAGSRFAGSGALFREQVALSGVVPMVGAVMGHCSAGTAYIPSLTDFVPMVKGTSSMALGGRHLVKAAVGEDVSEEEMGGSAVHTKISGVADLEVADDAECLATIRRYLSFFPAHNQEPPPVAACTDPVDRRVEELYTIVPTAPRRAYDMRRVVTAVVDGGDVLWIKPEYAKNIVTGLARVGGRPVGVVANQPMVLGGALDVNAADYIVAWPTAEISVMGPDGAVNIIFRRELDAIDDEEARVARRLELAEEIRSTIDPYVAAGHAVVDDVIDPADTRAAIARGLDAAATKQVVRPWRKHGVPPV